MSSIDKWERCSNYPECYSGTCDCLIDHLTGKSMSRLKPYVGKNHEGDPKFKVDRNKPIKPTKADKEEVKNANRSRKKGARQDGKRFIKKHLDLLSKGICPTCEVGILIPVKTNDGDGKTIEYYECDECKETFVKELVDGRDS